MNARAQEAGDVAFVTGSQVLHQSNNDPADDCPGDRINAAQDDGRECQQRGTPQRRVHCIGTYSEKDSANGGNGSGYTPCQRIHRANVDTHRQRGFLVERRGTHCQPIASVLEEIKKDGAQNDGHDNCQQVVQTKVDTTNVKTARDCIWCSRRDRIRPPYHDDSGVQDSAQANGNH